MIVAYVKFKSCVYYVALNIRYKAYSKRFHYGYKNILRCWWATRSDHQDKYWYKYGNPIELELELELKKKYIL